MKRYPHTATLEITTETGSGITGISKVQSQLIGRYEPAGQRNSLDQAAKFYTPKNPIFDNGNIDGQRLFYGGSWLGITRAFNYQTHAEIWLD